MSQTPEERAKEWMVSPALQPALDEYMRLSQELEDADVAYFGGLDEDKFLEHLLSYLNDPTSRDSMRIAIVRETIIQRQIALGRND